MAYTVCIVLKTKQAFIFQVRLYLVYRLYQRPALISIPQTSLRSMHDQSAGEEKEKPMCMLGKVRTGLEEAEREEEECEEEEEEHEDQQQLYTSRHQRCQHHDTPQETLSLSGTYVDVFRVKLASHHFLSGRRVCVELGLHQQGQDQPIDSMLV